MAEQSYKGTMSGIGEMENDINVIRPFFDARIRKFIIGQDGIISGFKAENGFINDGICVAQGFVGYYTGSPISISNGSYVYGKFVIYHDDNIVDEFYVVVADGEIEYENADILYEAGIFYLPLNDGKRINYPKNAYHSDFTNTVLAGGIGGDETNLQDGVTAVTQKVNDNSKKVATTEFVKNQIINDIGYDVITLSSEVLSKKGENKSIFTFNFIYKAKICVLNISKEYVFIKNPSTVFNGSIPNGTVIMRFPDKLIPKQEFKFYIQAFGSTPSQNHLEEYIVKTNGDLVAGNNCDTSSQETNNIGYECV